MTLKVQRCKCSGSGKRETRAVLAFTIPDDPCSRIHQLRSRATWLLHIRLTQTLLLCVLILTQSRRFLQRNREPLLLSIDCPRACDDSNSQLPNSSFLTVRMAYIYSYLRVPVAATSAIAATLSGLLYWKQKYVDLRSVTHYHPQG